jgi:uncharacterized damage-inducible protein DinB
VRELHGLWNVAPMKYRARAIPAKMSGVPHNETKRRNLLMTKAGWMLALILAATLGARAQDAAKKAAPPKTPVGPSQAVLDTWNDVARKLNTMAEDFPEDKYDFKPTPAQRSFAEQLLHAAGANYFFTNLANGQQPPTEEEPKRSTFKNKAEIVAYVKKALDDGAAAIKSKGDKGMSDTVVDPFANQQVRIIDFAYGFIEHMGEHYGQLAVYYRVAGLVPPESRPKK